MYGTPLFWVAVAGILSVAAHPAKSTLTAVTTSPTDNFFPIGGKAQVVLTVTDAISVGKLPVDIAVFDFTRTNAVSRMRGEIAIDGNGKGTATFDLPTDRYGIFYVSANAGGLTLPKVGTGPQGFFSYGVLEDPAKMPDLDPWDAFLGEHYVNTPWFWQRGGFGDKPSSNRLIVATLHKTCGAKVIGGNRFWAMVTNESIRAEYKANLTKYVTAAVAAGTGRQGRRIYETLWEPNLDAPDAESIVYVQKVSWDTIRALDPDALIGAYTSSGIDIRFCAISWNWVSGST